MTPDNGAYFLLFERETMMITGKVRDEKMASGTAGWEVGALLG